MCAMLLWATAVLLLGGAACERLPSAQHPEQLAQQLLGRGLKRGHGSSGSAGGGADLGRRLLADPCTGCVPDFCFAASGCSYCDASAGYQSDGAGGCTQGTPAGLAKIANPAGSTSRTAAATPFSIHPLCGENAVLRAGATGSVFGFGPAGQTVTLRLLNAKGLIVAGTTTKVSGSGAWRGRLGSLAAGQAMVLTAQLNTTKLVSRNIAVGYLLLASGQSNMVFSLADLVGNFSGTPYATAANQALSSIPNNNLLRLHKVPSFKTSIERVTVSSTWVLPSSASVRVFSSVAYLVALQLQQATGAPVGVVQASYGGTSITQWVSPATLTGLKNIPYTDVNAPSENYWNGMIAPLRYADFNGVLWYQGESDGGLASISPIFGFYQELLHALLASWRTLFVSPNLQFEIVQLPLFRSLYQKPRTSPTHVGLNHWPYVREGQRQVALTVANAGLVPAMDLGMENQIHPPDKFDVAARLLRGVRKNILKQVVGDTGPTFRSVAYNNNRQGVVSYDNVGINFVVGVKANDIGGVTRQPGSTLNCFELRYSGVWYAAVGKISGTMVVVTAQDTKVVRPDGVRYGWADFPVCNLYGSTLLPAVPFTTDANYDAGAQSQYG